MKARIHIMLCFLTLNTVYVLPCFSQPGNFKIPVTLLTTSSELIPKMDPEKIVDSLALTTSTAAPFCNFYSLSMKNIYRQTLHHDQPGKIFITRFLKQFADNFLYAWELNETNQSLQNTNWETYFSNPGAANWQLVVAGVNAHINGDMGKTLIGLFSIDELKKHRKVFIDARESLRPVMRKYLDTLKSQNKLFRFMYAASLGSPKLFANILLYKWRSRQYRLAMLYYRNPRRFTRLENRIAIKKQRIDRIIFNIQ